MGWSPGLLRVHLSPRKGPHARCSIWALFGFALAVRLIYLLEIRGSLFFEQLVGDGYTFDQMAQQLRAGDWVGDGVFYQAPLYPYFLAAVYTVFGHSTLAARVLQLVLGAASCALVALTGHTLISKRAGLVAGAFLSLYAPALFFEGLVQKAALSVFLTSCALYALARFVRDSHARWPLVAGLTLGLSALVRENNLALIVVVLLWALLARRERWKSSTPRAVDGSARPPSRWVRVGLMALGALLVLIPVAARNYIVGGEPCLSTSFGPNLYIGNNKLANGTYRPLRPWRGSALFERLDATELAEQALGRELGPSEVSHYWARRAFDDIAADPERWLALMLKKWLLVWNSHEVSDTEAPEVFCDSSRLLRTLWPILSFSTLLPLAVLGMVLTWPERRRLFVFYMTILTLAASIALFFVFSRYRMALVPPLALFAGAGVDRAIEALRRVREPRVALGLALAFVLSTLAALLANRQLVPEYGDRGMAYYNLGVVLQEKGDLDTAQAVFERALEESPTLVPAHTNLGIVYMHKRELGPAEEHFQHALRLRPGDAMVHTNLGDLRMNQQRYEEAIQHYERALQIDPMIQPAKRGLRIARRRLHTPEDR